MRRWSLLGTFLLIGAGLLAQEHQRLAATVPATQTWTLGLDASLDPVEPAWWSASIAGRLEGEWFKALSLSLSQPYRWSSDPLQRTVVGMWSPVHGVVSWVVGPQDVRWTASAAVDLAWADDDSRAYEGELGLRCVRDPVIFGVSVGAHWPESLSGVAILGSAFFQEVSNDNLSWSIAVSPRVDWYDGLPFWTIGVSWRSAWWGGEFGASSGFSTATGSSWSWSAAVERVWVVKEESTGTAVPLR